jgi:hypothetical protein
MLIKSEEGSKFLTKGEKREKVIKVKMLVNLYFIITIAIVERLKIIILNVYRIKEINSFELKVFSDIKL